jgi:hypothetical protein
MLFKFTLTEVDFCAFKPPGGLPDLITRETYAIAVKNDGIVGKEIFSRYVYTKVGS